MDSTQGTQDDQTGATRSTARAQLVLCAAVAIVVAAGAFAWRKTIDRERGRVSERFDAMRAEGSPVHPRDLRTEGAAAAPWWADEEASVDDAVDLWSNATMLTLDPAAEPSMGMSDGDDANATRALSDGLELAEHMRNAPMNGTT